MIEKYVVTKNKQEKYNQYKGIPFVEKSTLKNSKHYFLLGMTKLQKNKNQPSHQYLYYENQCFLVKQKIFGFTKGYIPVGKNNYIILKDDKKLFILVGIMILLLFSLFLCCINHNHVRNKPSLKIPDVKEILRNSQNSYISFGHHKTKKIEINSKKYSKKSPITSYEIIFDANGGYGQMKNMKIFPSQSIAINKNCYKRLGYTFLGWSTKKEGRIQYHDGELLTPFTNHDQKFLKLYAIWKRNTYSITYHLDGGVLDKSVDYYHINNDDISIQNPTKIGYDFLGWTDSYQKEPLVNYVLKRGSYGNKNLFAHYIPKQYYIIFDPNGGKLKNKNKTVSFNEKIGILPVPTKTGYTFVGWKDQNDKKIDSHTSFQYTEDLTLYAKWRPNTYSVQLNTKGGILDTTSLIVTYDDFYPKLPIPTKLGYSFEGWYYKGMLIDEYTLVDRNFNHELYAKWRLNTYTVTYLNPNQSVYTTKNISYFDTIPNLHYPVDSYHIFTGWTDSKGNPISSIKNLMNHLTVKANVKEVNCYLITGQAKDHDTTRITRFEQLLRNKNLGGRWSLEDGYYSFVSNSSNYSHIRDSANYLLANASSTSWPYLSWLGMFCDNGYSEQLR